MESYKTNLQGGVFISNDWQLGNPGSNPLEYFLSHCTIKILTDTSISCITLKCDLNDGILSPWKKFTSYAPFNDIRSILLKIFPHQGHGMGNWVGGNAPHPDPPYLRASRQGFNGYGGMERTNNATFNREVNIQTWLYAKSFKTTGHYAESICPSILYKIQGPVSAGSRDFIRDRVNAPGVFVERNLGHGRRAQSPYSGRLISDIEVVRNILNIPISICVMDLLDGYDTLGNLAGDPRIAHFYKMAAYELICLTQTYGILHGDAHPGNIMINPNYLYFSSNPLSDYRGRAIIIDFGRSRPALAHHVTALPLVNILTNHGNSNFLKQQLNALPGGIVAAHQELRYIYLQRRLVIEQQFINHYGPGNMIAGETWTEYINRITAFIPWAIDVPVNNPLPGAVVAVWAGHGGRRIRKAKANAKSITHTSNKNSTSSKNTSNKNKIEMNITSTIMNKSTTMASPNTNNFEFRYYSEEEKQKIVDNFEELFGEKLLPSRFGAFKNVSKEQLENAIAAEFRPPEEKLPEFTKENIGLKRRKRRSKKKSKKKKKQKSSKKRR